MFLRDGIRIAAKEGAPVYFTLLTSLLTPLPAHGRTALFMVRISQALQDTPPFMKSMHGWLVKFICQTSPLQNVVGQRHKDDDSLVTQEEFDRGERPAQVCPFVADSLDADNFWVERSAFTKEQTQQISLRLTQLIDEFVAAPPAYDPRKTGKPAPTNILTKCFLLYFPNFSATKSRGPLKEIDQLHSAHKPIFMGSGLAIGQFYPGCEQEGIYTDPNQPAPRKKFLSLVSPEPAFAIRYLAKHDSVFNRKGSDFRPFYEKYFPSSD
jgi:hypothetical protein